MENTENFDEGDTQVAPKGEFKAIGCGKIFHNDYGSFRCGAIEDLKHSDSILLCEDCKLNNTKNKWMMEKEFKEPYKVICGICGGFIEKSDNPEGELGYDGCEEGTETWRDY